MYIKEYLARSFSIDREIELEKMKYIAIRNTMYGNDWEITEEQEQMLKARKKVADDKINELWNTKQNIIDIIESVTDKQQREVLEYRYICKMKWHDIATTMYYEERRIYQIHKSAIDNISLNYS